MIFLLNKIRLGLWDDSVLGSFSMVFDGFGVMHSWVVNSSGRFSRCTFVGPAGPVGHL